MHVGEAGPEAKRARFELPQDAVVVEVLSDEEEPAASADEALARRLQEEENEAAAQRFQEAEAGPPELSNILGVPASREQVLAFDKALDEDVKRENKRRKRCEGPPCPPEQRVLSSSGAQRLQGGGRKFKDGRPCVTVDDTAVARTLGELGASPPRVACEANRALLRGLCAWRKHVVETYLERRVPGQERWRRTGICTSEQTFLGKRGGVLCLVAAASEPITSLPAFVAAFPRDAKQRPGSGLGPGVALCITLFFHWPIDPPCRDALRGLLAKLPKAERVKRWSPTSGFGLVYHFIERLLPIDPRLRHCVLSRAHLP